MDNPRTRSARGPLALMAVGAVVLLVIIGTATWLAQVTTGLSANVLQARAARTAASDELETLLDAETGQRGFLLAGNISYLQPYLRARARAAKDLHDLQQAERDNDAVRAPLRRLSQVSDAKLAELARTVALAQAGQRDQALALVNTDLGKNLMDQARSLLTLIVNNAEQTVSADLEQLTFNARLLRTVTIVGGLFIMLFAAFALQLLLRYIREAVAARREVEELNVSLEDRVVRRTAALTRANEEIQRFAYIVSHDLRAPLVNIMGFTSELEVGTKALQTYLTYETPETRPRQWKPPTSPCRKR